jgi:ketosteroid isomerase-like protein
MPRPRHLFVISAALAAAAAPLAAQQPDPAAAAQPAAPGSLRAAATDFIEAFNAMDEARFDAFWAEDATMFFPGMAPGHRADRITGRAAVLDVFHAFFAQVRPRRPRLNIRPEQIHVQEHGDAAILTFHLRSPDATGRRTFVWRRVDGRWLIAHLHASSLEHPQSPNPPPPPPTVPPSREEVPAGERG